MAAAAGILPLNGSHVIKGRWKIIKKIGQGAFGEIYQAKNIVTSEMVAIKVERVDSKKQVLKLEVAVLKKLQDSAYVCRFNTCGRFSNYNYMVMELLGENLSELRRKQSDGKFSLLTTLHLGQQMLRSIEAVHELGYLHRDIKPSNFAIGLAPAKRRTVFIIDFGLARRYLLSTGEVRPARDSTGFRGTARYASINSHLSKDLGRRDDLWSLLYVLIEFVKGSLPWRKIKDKDQIGEMKLAIDNETLCLELPKQFLMFTEHLQKLSYDEKPDYNHLQGLLQDMYASNGGHDKTPYDWELGQDDAQKTLIKARNLSSPRQTPSNSSKYSKNKDSMEKPEEKEEKDNQHIASMLRSATSAEQPYQNSPRTTASTVPPAEVTASSPLVSKSVTNPYPYVSSNMDQTQPKGQHRRSSSLPVKLSHPSEELVQDPQSSSAPHNVFQDQTGANADSVPMIGESILLDDLEKKKKEKTIDFHGEEKVVSSKMEHMDVHGKEQNEKGKCCSQCSIQ